MQPFVSIIIPCYNEEKYIRRVVENVMHQDYPPDRFEVIFIDGMSHDQTPVIIGEYRQKFPNIHLLMNEHRFVPFALNAGIRQAKGEVIIRMDAHSGYPQDYITKLVSNLVRLNADNVGGIWKTVPSGQSLKARAIAVAMSSAFGVGNALYRLGIKEIRKVDTVPFGCFPRTVFDRIGLFDEELLRNQDDEFNARIIRHGGSIYLIPDVEITYFARPSIASMVKMFYQYAFFKPLVNMKLTKPATLRQFIPPLFLLFLVTGLAGSLAWPVLTIPYLAVCLTYFLASLVFTLKAVSVQGSGGLIFFLPWLFLLQHLSYGYGYIAGMINFVLLKRSSTIISSSR